MSVKLVLKLFAPLIIGIFLLKMSSKTVSTAGKLAEAASKDVKPNPRPFPVLFVSHGGPTFMYENDEFGNKGAWHAVRNLGHKIKHSWKPDYLIVVSAHWQSSGAKLVEVGIPPRNNKFGFRSENVVSATGEEENPLIYDFYGFPDYMYKETFRTVNSHFIANSIKEQLEANGFHSHLTERGIDHGVWVPLRVAFSGDTKPGELDLPASSLIQVSLTGAEDDFASHEQLGKALSYFKNNLIWDPVKEKYLKGLVICSGMSVHNLRDLQIARRSGQKTMPYVEKFSTILSNILKDEHNLVPRLAKLKSEETALLNRAHPSLEHFVPLVIAGGANIASDGTPGKITELYNENSLSLAWGTYQFGDY